MLGNWDFNDKTYQLQRRPGEADPQGLRAWNSSDEYLLQQFRDADVAKGASVLVVNDQYGALALHTHDRQAMFLTDSLMSEAATHANLQANGFDSSQLQFVNPVNCSEQLAGRTFDIVLMKIPRQRDYLRMLAQLLRPHLHADSLILTAGMVKHLAPDARKDLAESFGSADVMRVWKKAIVIRCAFDPAAEFAPVAFHESFKVPELSREFVAYPNVFAAGRLDLGTRLLLEYLPSPGDGTTEYQDVADLGCGSGILSIAAAQKFPSASIHSIDESALALESTRAGFELSPDLNTSLHRSDGMSEFADASLDLVLCNPPFHAEAALSLGETTRLLKDIARVLRPAGEFRMVGRTSMPYVRQLSEHFSEVEVISKRSGFSIVSARSPKK